MPCPDFDTLLSKDNHNHLLQCESCNTLVQLRSLERPIPQHCEEVEGLVGIIDALSDHDRESVAQHLAACPACALASTLNDSPAQPNSDTIWKGPAMDANSQSSRIPTRYAIVGGLAAAALAAVITLTIRPAPDEPAALATVPQIGNESTLESSSRVGASRPSNSSPAVVGQTSQLERRANLASSSGDYTRLTDLCLESMSDDVDSNDAAYCCALAFGTSPALSTQLIDSIDDKKMRTRANKALADLTISLLKCDEIDCLVSPKQECCLINSLDTSALVTEQLASQAMALIKDKQYEAATQALNKALLFDPDHQEAHLMSAIAACHRRQFAVGKKHIEKIRSGTKRSSVKQICYRLGAPVPNENK